MTAPLLAMRVKRSAQKIGVSKTEWCKRREILGRIPDLSKIEVIDTHVHVWQADSPWMGWLDNRPSSWNVVRRDFSWENLCTELDAAGIHELMLMQAS
ncbi:MAG TPA: hypothetical protein PKX94_10985, partial [Opitutales bacterium]|nr:hypothetical protein [Opitutales bacterium]